jgi:hypothetical protein
MMERLLADSVAVVVVVLVELVIVSMVVNC